MIAGRLVNTDEKDTLKRKDKKNLAEVTLIGKFRQGLRNNAARTFVI
jgi:hypothetical protein